MPSSHWTDAGLRLLWMADASLLIALSLLAWSVLRMPGKGDPSWLSPRWRRVDSLRKRARHATGDDLAVLEKALYDPDEEVSYFSMLALGGLKHAQAAGALIRYMHERPLRAAKAASVLSGFPASSAGQFGAALDDTEPAVRYWSLRLLALLDDGRYADKAESLMQDVSDDVRAAACLYLGRIEGEAGERALERAAKDPVWFVRMQALRSLARKGPARHLPVFIEAIANDDSEPVKRSAENALLGCIEKAIPFLRGLLKTGDPLTKLVCVDALVESNQVSRMMGEILSDDAAGRREAAGVLGDLVDSGIHAGIGRRLRLFEPSRRERLFKNLSEVDAALAARLKGIHENAR